MFWWSFSGTNNVPDLIPLFLVGHMLLALFCFSLHGIPCLVINASLLRGVTQGAVVISSAVLSQFCKESISLLIRAGEDTITPFTLDRPVQSPEMFPSGILAMIVSKKIWLQVLQYLTALILLNPCSSAHLLYTLLVFGLIQRSGSHLYSGQAYLGISVVQVRSYPELKSFRPLSSSSPSSLSLSSGLERQFPDSDCRDRFLDALECP